MLPRCALAFALLLSCVSAALGQERPPNKVENPSLEGPLDAGGLPRGWSAWAEPARGYTASVVPGGRAAGKALLIEGDGGFCSVITTRHWIEPGKRYLARGWVKLEGDKAATAMVKLDYARPDGNYQEDVQARLTPQGTGGWQCVSLAAHADDVPGTVEIALAVCLTGKGKAWFDDLDLVVAEAARPGQNLLANGNMEDAAGDGPAYWSLVVAPDSEATLTVSEDAPKEGKRSLCLKGTAPWAVALGERYRPQPGKSYTLTGFVRAKGGRATLKIDYYRGAQYLGSSESLPVSANAWQERSVTSQVARYRMATHIVPAAIATGGDYEACFDGLVLLAR